MQQDSRFRGRVVTSDGMAFEPEGLDFLDPTGSSASDSDGGEFAGLLLG